MSMRAEKVAVNNQTGQTRIRPGEHPLDFLKRIQDGQAARDPAFALRQKIEKARAGFTDTTGEDGE